VEGWQVALALERGVVALVGSVNALALWRLRVGGRRRWASRTLALVQVGLMAWGLDPALARLAPEGRASALMGLVPVGACLALSALLLRRALRRPR